MSDVVRPIEPVTEPASTSLTSQPTAAPRSRRQVPPLLVCGVVMAAALLLVAVFGQILVPHDPIATSASSLQPPSSEHLLGTDSVGRDVFSRVVVGTRTTLLIAVSAIALALVVGLVLGLVAGYVGGPLDEVVMRCLDVVFAFPAFLLAVAVVAALGPSTLNLILTIAIVYTPVLARVVRGPVLSVRRWDHVEAARAMGASESRIMLRHVLPSVTSPILVETSLTTAAAIFTTTALSFLGLGPPPPDPNWGSMLAEGRQFMELSPFSVIGPAIAIVFATLTFILLSNGLRELRDVRGRQ